MVHDGGIRWASSRPLRPVLLVLGITAATLLGVAAALFVGSPQAPFWVLLLFPLVGGLYMGAGLVAWLRRPGNRFGGLLVLAGLVLVVAGFGNTDVVLLQAAGLIVAEVPIAVLVHLLVAFPSGRIRGGVPLVIVVGAYIGTSVLRAPEYLFAAPPDDLLSVDNRPDLVRLNDLVQTTVGIVVLSAAAVVLSRRLLTSEASQRRVLGAVYGYGIGTVLFILFSANLLAPRFLSPIGLFVAQVIVIAGVPVAFVAGLLAGGFARTGELDELGLWLGSADRDRRGVAGALRDVLGDPSLRIVFWVPERQGYVDEAGADAQLPAQDPGPGTVEITLAGRLIGAIVYDAGLIADPAPVASAGRVVAIAVDRERLTAELLASRDALRQSRARLVEAGDRERRRIARDLHDGLQGRLVMLALGAQRLADDAADPTARDRAGELRSELDVVIDELRRLVHGMMPAALLERGLVAATEDLVDRVPIPTDLDVDAADDRLPPAVESTAYFVVAESLANAVKHARASALAVRLGRVDGLLRIEVRDDGVGGARIGGRGLRGMADRVDALGGQLSVDSPLDQGTRIVADVPCGS
ncbi:MAG: sensor histidine kinase [Geodermatophilaceae bacterium]